MNLFMQFERKASTKLLFISSSLIFLKASSIWKLLIPLFIFIYQSNKLFTSSFTFFVFLLLCSWVRQTQEPFLSSISNFRCSKLVNVRSIFYFFINQFFPVSKLNAFKPALIPFLNKVFAPSLASPLS